MKGVSEQRCGGVVPASVEVSEGGLRQHGWGREATGRVAGQRGVEGRGLLAVAD